jgi:hypothetical protein
LDGVPYNILQLNVASVKQMNYVSTMWPSGTRPSRRKRDDEDEDEDEDEEAPSSATATATQQ